jgi:uncharacterized protein YdhG (YjbR/CyaY superfamily)
MTSNAAGVEAVDRYLSGIGEPGRSALDALRTTLRSLLPQADECLKYGMPAFAVRGKGVAGYAAFARHCGYFPMSGSVLERAGDAVDGYVVSKGGLQFPIDGRLPDSLVRTLVELRLAEIEAATGRGRSRSR